MYLPKSQSVLPKSQSMTIIMIKYINYYKLFYTIINGKNKFLYYDLPKSQSVI